MASKGKKEHRKRVKKFQETIKNKINKMEQKMNLPQVREVPVWNRETEMAITGAELELLYNYISSVSGAYSAAQSIMQRNILNGNIKVEFDELQSRPDGSFEYVRLTGEKADAQKKQFDELLKQIGQLSKQLPQENTNEQVIVEDQSTDTPHETAKVISLEA